MIAWLIGVPAGAGLLAFVLRSDRLRRTLLVAAAAGHAGLTAAAWRALPARAAGSWLGLDAAGLLFLSVTSLLFLAVALYAVDYLRREAQGIHALSPTSLLFRNTPEAVFTGCLLLFFSAMTLVLVSRHFGLLWVAVEATTLASAPLIYFHRHDRSLEATWKYLLLCSIGIALALLGTFFLGVAGQDSAGRGLALDIDTLSGAAGRLRIPWLKAAMLLGLIGYGTKMGLAPMHSWLPDAHSEAPSLVSALLSGALLNCAFLGILRLLQVCTAAGVGAYAREAILVFGLLSMAVAAAFILGQTDYKRLLAYSSVEHMGILAVGVGLGGVGTFGALYHLVNHSLAKGMLFLAAGNVLAAYGTKSAAGVRGSVHRLPVSGALWLAGFLAICGSPPFGTFMSELVILQGALATGRWVTAAAFLAVLAVVFVGMGAIILRMALGADPDDAAPVSESRLATWPAAALGLLVLGMGLVLPAGLEHVLRQAAALFGGAL